MTAAPVPPRRLYTIAEYLAFEETAEQKHEYHDGEILAMSGGTLEHSRIIKNTIFNLALALRGKRRENFESNLRVRIPSIRRYLYPDSTIICGPPEFDSDDPKKTTVVNPGVIIEVLPPTTEAYDRGAKFAFYQKLLPLQEYVLISQSAPLVETFRRQPNGPWLYTPFAEPAATLLIATCDIRIPLADIYATVTFEPPVAPPDPREREQP
jgi:Uma2 family endonuclease